ncbi:hypothetical protein IscW_ISCW023216 [Ixodes scapularis]|uniref:Uncharacterized protein n=1 Tax=Ixodes scapularis TaxID=6945 RepID=B7QJ99_IXOSC|nr:hypothetical protein IscW_ISCW023216 [Ixodes scapularis]|eukprot:XP_002415256.1 hypothetical protein IscW_ISCW023216 [Ixodes scapularis]
MKSELSMADTDPEDRGDRTPLIRSCAPRQLLGFRFLESGYAESQVPGKNRVGDVESLGNHVPLQPRTGPGRGTPGKAGLIARRPNAHWAEIKTSAAAAADKAQQLGQSTARLLPDHDGGAVERRMPPAVPPSPSSDNGARRSRQRRWLHRRMGASAQVPPANDSRKKRTGDGRGVQAGCRVAPNLLDEGPLALAATLSNPTEHFRSSCFRPPRSVATWMQA